MSQIDRLYLMLVYASFLDIIATNRNVTRNYDFVPGNFESDVTSPSPCSSTSSCAAFCTSSTACVGFLFNTDTSRCQIVTHDISGSGSPSASSWKYFLREPRVCPSGWVQFNYVCYYFHNSGGSWDWAKNQCHAFGAKFVQITTEDEDTFIRNHILSIGYTNSGNRDFWIGGTDIAVEGEWRWIETGELYTYTKWGPSNPDNRNGNQHCGILFQPTGYMWHDTECTNTNSYICEL